MGSHFASLRKLAFIVVLLFNGATSSASEWRTVELSARALNVAENNGTLWVCGADELIATSADGGNTWTSRHSSKNGSLLLTVGFANEQFGYAAGTGGQLLITRDGGNTCDSTKVPSQVVYEADATNSGIGERLAASARNWIFLPFMKDGVVHPANTEVKLRVQAIKSK